MRSNLSGLFEMTEDFERRNLAVPVTLQRLVFDLPDAVAEPFRTTEVSAFDHGPDLLGFLGVFFEDGESKRQRGFT